MTTIFIIFSMRKFREISLIVSQVLAWDLHNNFAKSFSVETLVTHINLKIKKTNNILKLTVHPKMQANSMAPVVICQSNGAIMKGRWEVSPLSRTTEGETTISMWLSTHMRNNQLVVNRWTDCSPTRNRSNWDASASKVA